MNDAPHEGWAEKKCRPCRGGMSPLDAATIGRYLDDVEGWALSEGRIERTFTFKNYYETIAFVNALAWVAHREDHHPDIEVGYKTCRVRYMTHAAGGLTDNDFICAAKIDTLFA